MLKGISPVVSPDLLKAMAEMGHGDEIVFSDAHFPAHQFGRDCAYVLRADGLSADRLLAGVAPLLELDPYVAAPIVMMAPVPGDTLDPEIERRYRAARRNPLYNAWKTKSFTDGDITLHFLLFDGQLTAGRRIMFL